MLAPWDAFTVQVFQSASGNLSGGLSFTQILFQLQSGDFGFLCNQAAHFRSQIVEPYVKALQIQCLQQRLLRCRCSAISARCPVSDAYLHSRSQKLRFYVWNEMESMLWNKQLERAGLSLVAVLWAMSFKEGCSEHCMDASRALAISYGLGKCQPAIKHEHQGWARSCDVILDISPRTTPASCNAASGTKHLRPLSSSSGLLISCVLYAC